MLHMSSLADQHKASSYNLSPASSTLRVAWLTSSTELGFAPGAHTSVLACSGTLNGAQTLCSSGKPL